MVRHILLLGCCAAIGFNARAALVWQSTFDSTADGVVDIFDNDSGKAMIGSNSGGRQQIVSWDNTTNAYTPDKAGRPLGATVSRDDSFSGLYEFNWSNLAQTETQAYEAAGFLGTVGGTPQTRQIMGTLLRHWKAGADYYVAVDLAVGGQGATAFGYVQNSACWLGTNPYANDYKLAIGYDGSTHVLNLGLYDSSGTLMTGMSKNLYTEVPGLQQYSTPAVELGLLQATHLGWSDYSGNLGDVPSVWNVDSLSYFNTADGAALAATTVPEPTSILAIAVVTGASLLRRRR
jgi:hypothetical protein